MGDIGSLPPAYRILPGQPGARPGEGNKAPLRRPENDRDRQPKKRRPGKDDKPHIDEYA